MSERRGAKGLELWCKRITEGYPGVKVDNMTTSWRNGLAFCAIIHHFRPDLIDFTKLNKDDVYHNNDLAFRVAEQYLGIPALLEPEDMVEYSVPDRLSILTYLSQFYQTFVVAQGQSSVRISPKRPSPPNPDHGIVSPASTSPPTKMAFLGANKSREPCTKCNLPVFMAERLIVEKLLFHRTCFRCARCDSQLTPANSYETENNEFCCEICPDEGKTISKEKLLQRSVSDEEKTANLRTFSNEPDNYSALFETALESAKDSAGYSTARSEFFQSQLVSGSESGNEEVPPDLPNNAPPEISSVNVNSSFSSANSKIKDSVSKCDFVTKDKIVKRSDTNSLVRARARLFENNDFSKSDVYKKLHESPKRSIPIVKLDDLENFDDNLSKKSTNDDIVLLSSSNEDNLKHNTATKDESVEEIGNVDAEMNEKDAPDNVITEDSLEHNIVTENKSLIVKTVDVDFLEDQSKQSSHTVTAEGIDIEKETNSNEHSLEPIIDQLLTKTTVDVNIATATVNPSVEKQKEDDFKMMDDTQETEIETIAQVVVSDNDGVENVQHPKHVELEEQQGITTIATDSTSDEAIITHISTETNSSPLADKPDVITIEDSPSSVITISDSSSVSVQNIADSMSTTSLPSENASVIEKSSSVIELSDSSIPKNTSSKVVSPKAEGDYPKDLNPFGDDDDDDDEEPQLKASKSLNPFGSDSDDDGVEQIKVIKPVPSPRLRKKLSVSSEDNKITGTPEQLAVVYTTRVSRNPFDSDEDVEDTRNKSDQPSSEMSSMNPFWSADEEADDKQPVPIPRSSRAKKITATRISLSPLWSNAEEYDDAKQPVPMPRLSRTSTHSQEPRPVEDGAPLSLSTINFGSNSSISSGSAYGSARKKKPAPRPPLFTRNKESGASSIASSPSHSLHASPKSTPRHRKNKRAPAPPANFSTPIEMTKSLEITSESSPTKQNILQVPCPSSPCILSPIPLEVDTMINQKNAEEEKIVKDEVNRNRQNQHTNLENFNENLTHCSVPPNKSTYGKWKRRKGQAPSKPIPQKRTIKCLPMTEIERELEMIELQQQGLERQGVRLEQIIRDKCETGEEESGNNNEPDIPIDIDDLLLQLFELMNEKVELFRKQTELMYLKRQQRLEEEHADVEYKIRCLMMLPEANKTDTDKASEEELIKRLVEIVEQRNRIIECLEMDRVREAKEDDSITTHINLYTSKKEEKPESDTLKKDKEKEKKKHKKEKKSKHKNVADIDKDIDETEHCSTLEKKKKFNLSLF